MTLGTLAAQPKRVLVIHSFVNAAPPFTTHSTAFEQELIALSKVPIDLDEVSLDVARYASLDMEKAIVDLMQQRRRQWQPDLIVPVGSPAGMFIARHRDDIFPGTPVIYCGMDRRRLPPDELTRNAVFVGEEFNLPGFMEDILEIAPGTTNVAVVIGASPLEQFWKAAFETEFERYADRVSIEWLDRLPFNQMLDRVGRLPPRSFIFLILYMRDASGVTHNADEALQRIRAVANAPVNGIFQHQLGLGIVGGRLYQAEQEGIEAAQIAIRVLQGESPTNFPPRIIGPLSPRYDARELERWNIDEKALPPGSQVLFREPSFWARYHVGVITVSSFVVAQASLIFLLLLNRTRRRRAEREAKAFGGRLIQAQETERARLARELHDDITQRLASLAIDAGRAELAGSEPERDGALRNVREGLVRLSGDVHSLSYQLHPTILKDLGLVTALKAECEKFRQHESIQVTVAVAELPPGIPGDVGLCLFRVTQEALRNAARHAHTPAVEVSLRPDAGGLRLVVADQGIGFDPDQQRQPSLGLESMKERVRLLEGELEIESVPGAGTTIVAWVPLARAAGAAP